MSIIFRNLNRSFICLVPDTGFRIPDSGFRIPDPFLDSGFRIPDPFPDSGFQLFHTPLHASLLRRSINFIGFLLLGSVFGHFSIRR